MKNFILVLACAAMLASCAPNEPAKPEEAAQAVEGRGDGIGEWWTALPRPEWAAYERVLTDLRWYEVYRIFPDVYAIYEPGQFEEVISFLIIGESRALLFDTGLGIAPIEPVIERLTDLDVVVLNSHSHYDHIGGNYEYPSVLGLDNAYSKARVNGIPNAKLRDYVEGDWIWKETPEEFDPKTYQIKPYTVGGYVRDGEIIDLGGIELEILETPGHAPDSICLLDRDGRRIFMGDTFYLAPLYVHVDGSDFAQYSASADRLAPLASEVDYLVTSHNVPVVESRYLTDMKEAFDAVASGKLDYVETDGAREYSFEGFSILAPADLN